jgi:hypothetical protein
MMKGCGRHAERFQLYTRTQTRAGRFEGWFQGCYHPGRGEMHCTSTSAVLQQHPVLLAWAQGTHGCVKGVLRRYRHRQGLSLRLHPLNVIIITIMATIAATWEHWAVLPTRGVCTPADPAGTITTPENKGIWMGRRPPRYHCTSPALHGHTCQYLMHMTA